jgi:hypothetical protein
MGGLVVARVSGKRRTRDVIAPVVTASPPDAYDAGAIGRSLDEIADRTNALISRPALRITSGAVTIARSAITLVAGAGVTIVVEDDPASDSATITFTSP